jgi:hypothetical protein
MAWKQGHPGPKLMAANREDLVRSQRSASLALFFVRLLRDGRAMGPLRSPRKLVTPAVRRQVFAQQSP